MLIKFKNSSGQTLVEAIIALSLLVIILSATAVAVLTSVNNSVFVKQQNQANKLAQQGLEYMRDQISNNNMIATYRTYTDAKCLNEQNSLLNTACTANDYVFDQFKREVNFESGNCGAGNTFVNGLYVTVTVSWTSSKCTAAFCNKKSVRSCFLDVSKQFPTTYPTAYQGI
ncbi:MAG: prepilin-type N-terminal cleavage/methylation domain-containing protein [Candidatus Levybacteria bacterium]|nr:prepilin-type N-terminal cleavage/methylation domain-containing protein [Candidatus Levybacteria bacterium]